MLKEEFTYYAGLPEQFEDEDAIYQVDSSTETEEVGNEQYFSEDSSDVFIGSAAEGHSVRLQRDFYQKYTEHKELSKYVWEAMHAPLHPQVLL